jgi:HJR/Mrr/RecB family endonuclease
MKLIEAAHAAYEIDKVMNTARESVALFAPDGWQFFSFENYPPLLYDVAEKSLNTRFLFGQSMFPTELDTSKHLPHQGCSIRIKSTSDGHTGYIIVDHSHAIQGRYVPGYHYPYLALNLEQDEKAITELIHHFEGEWASAVSVEVLFPTLDHSKPILHIPTLVEVAGWTPKLMALVANPDDLYRMKPREFEEFVAELLNRDGFETTLTPQTRDGGRDILAVCSLPTGPMLCLVECKRYAKERLVGVEYIRGLFGTVTSDGASNGLIVTTSSFSNPTREFARRHQYRLELKEYADIVAWIRKAVQK